MKFVRVMTSNSLNHVTGNDLGFAIVRKDDIVAIENPTIVNDKDRLIGVKASLRNQGCMYIVMQVFSGDDYKFIVDSKTDMLNYMFKRLGLDADYNDSVYWTDN